MTATVFETKLSSHKLIGRGKVRDIYDLKNRLLIVSSDRISAFDSVLPTPIPDKGRVLTGLSTFWFDFLGSSVEHHLITADVDQMPDLGDDKETLRGRSMLVRKAEVVPIECVVRGYLMGSGWKEYQEKNRTICGIELPPGLKNGSKLPEAIFTPSTKSKSGHDENVSFEGAISRLVQDSGYTLENARDYLTQMRERSLTIYKKAYEHALTRGIIIADTKFEFGVCGGKVILIDEVLTPDSSRFWPKEAWTPGKTQLSYDKQFLRDYLEGIGWNKEPPAPALPSKVVNKTREKYIEVYKLITGLEYQGA